MCEVIHKDQLMLLELMSHKAVAVTEAGTTPDILKAEQLPIHYWCASGQCKKKTYKSRQLPSKLRSPSFGVKLSHLVRLPVPEKVDRSVHPPLNHGPATWIMSLVTPHLHKPVGILRLHQVHAAASVAIFQCL